jgi:coproporphyrinogen III oxidase-like Fe-S oxidoreductase
LRNYFKVWFLEINEALYRDTGWSDFFPTEYKALKDFADDGIVDLGDYDYIRITEIGQQFADKVCEIFDEYK